MSQAALLEAMERLRKKNQALEIEKAQAVERFQEQTARLRRTTAERDEARAELARLRKP